MNMWQQTEEMAKKHEQDGSQWLKLANDGDKAVVVFLGEPHPREVCFIDGKYVPLDDKLKAQGVKYSMRVAYNVALFDSKEVKVFEQGRMFFNDLVHVRGKYGLEKWAFEVQRHGAPKDPKTNYSILPEHQLSVEQQKEFLALPVLDLKALYNEDNPQAPKGRATATIEPKEAQDLVTQLKALPRDAIDRFLQKFGIQRIKELPAAQLEEAKAFVQVLQQEVLAKADESDINPFT